MLAKGEWPQGEHFLYAGYQTAGRGQTGNSWESEEGKNLLCSILLPPNKNLYFLNIAVSVALIRLIDEQLTIKWPNDIYWKDKKLAGILLENAIIGSEVKYAIAGIGLNVNQTTFVSNAPNPVSLKQITGKEYDIDKLMKDLFEAVNTVLNEPENVIWSEYKSHLYRREGYWRFEDKNGSSEAHIEDVLPTGEIVLSDKNGQVHQYGFKQIKYIL
jgi:BirA family biotin operon repressor/biotin-[acetyl-CoA-carboxylase] ligase